VSRATVLFLAKLFFGLKYEGVDNIPLDYPVMLAANHISLLDPPIVGSAVRRQCSILAKKELFKNRIIAAFLAKGLCAIPLNRRGIDRKALKTVNERLAQNHVVMIFPEGTRARKGKKPTVKMGLGYLLMENQTPVIPAYVEGTDNLFQAFLRKKPMRVVFGKEIRFDFSQFEASKETYQKLSDAVMERIRSLHGEN